MTFAYTTAAKVEAELRASTAFSTSTTPTLAEVTVWINEESAYINQIAERIFSTTQTTETMDYNGEEYIFLEHSPIVSVDQFDYNPYAITSSSYSGGWVTKTADSDYTLYDDKALIQILFANFNPEQGSKRLRIQYTYGYTTTPAIVEMLCTKLVAERVLNTLLNYNLEQRNDGGSVSVGSISIVEPSNYGMANFTRLKDSIERLKDEVIGKFKVFRLRY